MFMLRMGKEQSYKEVYSKTESAAKNCHRLWKTLLNNGYWDIFMDECHRMGAPFARHWPLARALMERPLPPPSNLPEDGMTYH
jgi:superfamily II DNA or RNA helicase